MIGSVLVIEGMRRGVQVTNQRFPLVQSLQADEHGLYIVVDGSGLNGFPQREFRITVNDPSKLVINLKDEYKHLLREQPVFTSSKKNPNDIRTSTNDLGVSLKSYATEIEWPTPILYPTDGLGLIDDDPCSDQDILDRICDRFIMLRKITGAIRDDQAKGVIIYGGPGTGKSFEVEDELKRGKFGDKHYLIIKGYVTPPALFQLLYDNQSRVLVFDDSDSVLDDEDSLNTLKGALDTTEERIISWNTAGLDKAYPRQFEYKGRIIFITNKNLEKILEIARIAESKGRSPGKLIPHLDAMMSRCDYLDLTMDTPRERFLRIQQVTRSSRMLVKKGCTPLESEEVLGFMRHNIHNLRDLSLRTAIRIGGYMKIDRKGWVDMAKAYTLKRKKK